MGDDGRGFSFDQAARGLGIAGMRERALLVGGDVEVESGPDVGNAGHASRCRSTWPIQVRRDGKPTIGSDGSHR